MVEIPGYRLTRKLASGASGTVYRAFQEALQREVAVKVLAPGLFGQAETRARFVREARLQAKLAHPNLLALFDAGVAGEQAYLVMELVEGGSLRALLRRLKRLSLAETLRLGRQISAALAHAHAAGICHRDLKPENILLTEAGDAKVADFGLAKSQVGAQQMQTAAGVILGTPGYLAPEAIQGSASEPTADVYALGVLLFEMLTGTRPFRGADLAELFRNQLDGAVSELSPLCPDVPPALAQLVRSCLEREPSARPATAADVLTALERIPTAPAAASPTMAMSSARAATGPNSRVLSRHLAAATQAGRRTQPALPSARPIPGRRAVLALVVLAAAGLLGLGLHRFHYISMPPEERSGPLAGRAEQAHRSDAARRPVPRLLRVDAGADRARFVLSGPPPPGLRAVCRREGRDPELDCAVPEGQRTFVVSGLAPRTRYLASLAGPGAELPGAATSRPLPGSTGERPTAGPGPVPFSTLERPWRSPALSLGWGAAGRVDNLSLAAHGEAVVMLYTCWKGSVRDRLEVRESLDCGATWSAPTPLGLPGEYVAGATAFPEAKGTAVVWTAIEGGHLLTRLRRRPDAFSPWSPAVELLRSSEADRQLAGKNLVDAGPTPSGLARTDGTLMLLVPDLVAGRLAFRRASLAPGAAAARLSGPVFDCPRRAACADETVSDGSRLVSVIRARGHLGQEQLVSTYAGATPLGETTGSSPVHLLWTEDTGRGFDLEAIPGKVFLAYEVAGHIKLRQSSDGGSTWTTLPAPIAGPETESDASLTAGSGLLHLSIVRYRNDVAAVLATTSTRDGVHWAGHPPRQIPTSFGYRRIRSVTCGRTLVTALSDHTDRILAVVTTPLD